MHISKYIYNIQILEIWVIVKYSTWHLDYPEKHCSTFRWLQKKNNSGNQTWRSGRSSISR